VRAPEQWPLQPYAGLRLAAMITAMMIRPVSSSRMPALAPQVLSIETTRNRKRQPTAERYEREHPVRLDTSPAPFVAAVRAPLLKEFGAFTAASKRRENRYIETLCMMFVFRARSSAEVVNPLSTMQATGPTGRSAWTSRASFIG
jgi:hypothetical protein